MKLWKYLITTAIGIGLLAGTLLTASTGLAEEDLACYEQAVSLQSRMDGGGFPGFLLTDYPVAFCDGKHDYVLVSNGMGYDVIKRPPVMETMAATAWEVDGHYEVIAPTKALMEHLITLMGGSYDTNAQAAVIWHEAFHCWQLTEYADNIAALTGEHSFEEEDYGESMILEQCDKNPEAIYLFEQQLDLLSDAIRTKDIDKVREDIVKYQELEAKRNAMLDDTVRGLEEYYTIVEGSAHYIEASACRLQDEQSYQEQYIDSIPFYIEGSGKYYTLGMAQCLLLDRLDENWKTDYDFSGSLMELIYEKLGV